MGSYGSRSIGRLRDRDASVIESFCDDHRSRPSCIEPLNVEHRLPAGDSEVRLIRTRKPARNLLHRHPGVPILSGRCTDGVDGRPLDLHANGRPMHPETRAYNRSRRPEEQDICDLLACEIDRLLPEAENKIWHAHPVWFLDGNPVVGYNMLKDSVRLLFWSGQSFATPGLSDQGSFKAAKIRYTMIEQVNTGELRRWLAEARDVQWDYKNIVRRKGRLERLR